jgi:type 2A phosphatase activator TIP41
MSHSFLLLFRAHTRIDNVLIRQRDTRLFHAFGTDYIVREATLRELSWDRIDGASGEGASKLLDEEWCARTLLAGCGDGAVYPTDSNVVLRDVIGLTS